MKALKFDEHGLIPAIVQDRLTGEVRMCAFMNQASLERTLSTGRATFFSRSRQALWEKGETSGNVLNVHEMYADCDGDTILVLVDPVGHSCHTGKQNCFFRRVSADGIETEGNAASAFLPQLEAEIESRRSSSAEKSYTKSLLEAGATRISAKMREEADEFARAVTGESDERVASEAADVVYHLLVGLASRRISWRAVLGALAKRAGTSGHAEKAARGPKGG
jgi:phosphoribosyl-ATP pyrophosphohydrolase/phosphoribosyl-AMP cyclohydrolase